ncbi:hypothetical protein VYU27_001135 [Nannochloropsis oceanica]
MADPNAYHVFPGDEVGGGLGKDKDVNLEPSAAEREKEAYLHPCCQKELESTRARTKLMSKLRAVDITRQAMDRRKGVVGLSEEQHQHEHGAGCCALMADYPALARLRVTRDGGVGTRQDYDDMERRRSSSGISSREVVASYEEGEDEEDSEEDGDDDILRELEAGDDGGFLEIRRAELMRQAQEAAEIQYLGIGLHTELPPNRVLDLVYLRCCHLVVHCYDPYGETSAVLDLQLEGLAKMYPGTRFVRTPFGGGEGLRQALRVPAPGSGSGYTKSVLLSLRDGSLVDSCYDYGRRFGEGREGRREGGEVYLEAVEQWLRHCQVLERERMDVERARKMRLLLKAQMGRKGGKGGRTGVGMRMAITAGGQERDEEVEDGGEDEDEAEFYECGLEGCYKPFIHSHVGMEGIQMPKEFGAIGEH